MTSRARGRIVASVAVLLLAVLGVVLARRERLVEPPPIPPAAADEFQLFVLGASTAVGVPYHPALDLGSLVAFVLDGRIAGRRIEVVNLAEWGRPSAQALEEARRLVEHAHPENAAILVYLGDNEFLRFDTGPPERKLERRLFDEPVCAPDERARILDAFEDHVREIVELAQRRRIPLVLSTVATHLRDWEPNRSVLSDAAHQPRIEEWLADADAAVLRGDRAAEERALRAALEMEPEFAWTWYRLGKNLVEQARYDEARVAFQRRVDTDGFPTTILSTQNEALRRLASERAVPLFDAESALQLAAEHGLPGYDWFSDNCHPNLRGFALIADGLAQVLAHELEPGRVCEPPTPERIAAHFGLDGEFRLGFELRRAQYFYGQALLTWNPEQRLVRSEVHIAAALAIAPDDVHAVCSSAIVALIRGDVERSRTAWRRALAIDAAMARARGANPVLEALAIRAGLDGMGSLLR